MAFQPSVSYLSEAYDSSYIAIKDSTPTYGTASLYGYGTPGGIASASVVSRVLFFLQKYEDTSTTPIYFQWIYNNATLSPSYIAFQSATGINLYNTFTDGVFSLMSLFTDNYYDATSALNNPLPYTITAISSDNLTLTVSTTQTGANFQFDNYFDNSLENLVLDFYDSAGLESNLYPVVDAIATGTYSGTLQLKSPLTIAFPLPATINIYKYWLGSTPMLLLNQSNAKIVNAIGNLPAMRIAVNNFDLTQLWGAIMAKLAAEIAFGNCDYDKANKIAYVLSQTTSVFGNKYINSQTDLNDTIYFT